MEVDQDAPAIAKAEIEIAAGQQVVWDLLTDFERWPEWQPNIRSISISGEVAEGSVFRWKPGPTTITSTIRHVDPPREIAWTGKTFGISAVHVWRLEPAGAGTSVSTEESWAGIMVRALRGSMRKMLQKELDTGLERLKAEAERQAG